MCLTTAATDFFIFPTNPAVAQTAAVELEGSQQLQSALAGSDTADHSSGPSPPLWYPDGRNASQKLFSNHPSRERILFGGPSQQGDRMYTKDDSDRNTRIPKTNARLGR